VTVVATAEVVVITGGLVVTGTVGVGRAVVWVGGGAVGETAAVVVVVVVMVVVVVELVVLVVVAVAPTVTVAVAHIPAELQMR
jgi:hypothetical protein